MKKAVILGKESAGLVDVPTPQAVKDWALVKVHVTPMCTEYKAFRSGAEAHYLGHEAVGEVVEIAQPGRVKVGDRVVVMPLWPCGTCALCVAGDYIYCEHMVDLAALTGSREGSATYAQYLLKPAWLLPAIPDDVTYEMAALALCALGPSFGAFEALNLNAFDTVLITGAGPVGLGAVVNARYRGARVIVAESNPYRSERARLLGAETVVDPHSDTVAAHVRELTGGLGVDAALDCSGVVAAQRLCIDAARRRGRVAFVGECSDDLPIKVSPDMIRKGLTIIGSWHYNLNHFPKIMQVIRSSPVVANLVSHVLPMSEIQQAFEISSSQQCAKILLKPWE
jgi:L-iditol 2-dehydrogenase